MAVDWLLDRMASHGEDDAIIWNDAPTSYAALLTRIDAWRRRLDAEGVSSGTVVALVGDYAPEECALLLALLERGAIAVPLTTAGNVEHDRQLMISEARVVVVFDGDDDAAIEHRAVRPENDLLRRLAVSQRPGIVVFSSGSTGEIKGILHDAVALLEKFEAPRRNLRVLTFLLLDHLGGLNTLLYTLANGGTVITAGARDPRTVCAAIERHRVELLPTSPTFLNMLLVSEEYLRHDLSSLQLVTYGTEVMPEATLHRIREALPHVELLQTYGLSELGVLRSRSRHPDSLWVRVGGEGFETKVVDGTLRIRAKSAMVGYLNAPSPFDSEGWFDTEDLVEVDGDHFKFLGRKTEIINVGGQKVYPAEVESVLLEMENVADATVVGEANPLLGRVVVARLLLSSPEDPDALKTRVRRYCRERLAPFKVPVRVEVAEAGLHSERFKRVRT